MRPSTTAALWTAFTVAAVATGLGAVTLVRNALTTPAADALTPSQVVAELATTSPRPSPPPQLHSRTPEPSRTASPSRSPSTSRTSAPASGGPTSAPQTSAASPPPAGPTVTSQTRTLASRAGTVRARCSTGGRVYLTSWSPATGYRVEDVARGPAPSAEVWFDGPYEVHITVTCQNGLPFAEVEQERSAG